MDKTNDINIFNHYAPFIREFIYRNDWEELRSVQVEAAKSVFFSQNNILICSKTASGKTEAAFFPVLSVLESTQITGFGAIYLAPLKTLINDQFKRIDLLLGESNTPVFHWHGDVPSSHKKAALKNPRGILQITPESLEGMMLSRSISVRGLFHDLQFVIIDEIHFMTGTDRGNQVRCILERLARIIGRHPRRIGLSATVGDPQVSAEWLGENTGRDTEVVFIKNEKVRLRLACEHFFTQNAKTHTIQENKMYENYGDKYAYFLFSDEANKYVYNCAKGRFKSLIFLNTREETEHMTVALREIAKVKNEDDMFHIHHGNISKELREETENRMKDDGRQTATCATVTMELGIDIGSLERVIHLGAPNSVSSFLQRLGRSGRRRNTHEMILVINEDIVKPDALLPHSVPWDLLKAIAVIQLYVEERWIEPPYIKKMPFSLLFHQTLCILASSRELRPEEFNERVLSLSTFRHIDRKDYRTLLFHMLKTDMIQLTEEKTLIVGLEGEKLINSHKFLATFKNYEEYKVMHGNSAIGTVTSETPVGYVFLLAGFSWEVTEVIPAQKIVIVKKAGGSGMFPWPGSFREIHTRIIRQIRKVLSDDTQYPYLKPNAAERLRQARDIARSSGMLTQPVLHLGGAAWCIFPWLGSKSNWTLRRFLRSKCLKEFGLTEIEYGDWFYIRLNIGKGDGYGLIEHIRKYFQNDCPDLDSLVGERENPVYERYDEYVPQELIRRGYVADRMQGDEINEWLN
ncbi:MAG: DEAD/DEAH box helicase [Defluviitaleaceae bacterium]|nr:DEAD/DEAH box helicase [Defluviitaleaceae bacterium]MCL2835240.1 DEAD/DEAH box helicase [Defluviitaleaceae bacterium]